MSELKFQCLPPCRSFPAPLPHHVQLVNIPRDSTRANLARQGQPNMRSQLWQRPMPLHSENHRGAPAPQASGSATEAPTWM
eukprot:7395199-Alexandrium_andersonii.AAC.1